MSANTKWKLKLLYIMKILLEQSDEEHPLTVNDIITELAHYDISAERKSIYSDIELLMRFGLDIICEKERANKYFVGKRDFELPELKLLVDVVQSSKFITHKKSKELIKKIEDYLNTANTIAEHFKSKAAIEKIKKALLYSAGLVLVLEKKTDNNLIATRLNEFIFSKFIFLPLTDLEMKP